MLGQTIDPAEDFERCPTPNYPNGAGQSHTITFPDSAKFYSIGTTTNCTIMFYNNNISGEPFKATCTIQFKDQSAQEHKFEVKKGATVVKTFVFTKIKSIADRTLEGGTTSVNAPICNTSPVFVSFTQMKYRKTGSSSSADDYGSPIPFYEYQLPQGWTITSGYVGTSSTPGLVVGTNNVTIQPNFLRGGDIKVRAVNAQCGDFFNKSQWRTIPTGRPVMNLTSNGAETISINCAEITPRTFTLQNAASCITSYTWTVGANWLYNGSPAPATIQTTTNSITLEPVSILSQPPTNISVTATASSETFTDAVTITFTNNPPPLSITGDDVVCDNKPYQLIMGTGYRFTGSSTWGITPTGIANTGADPNDPTNDKKVLVTRIGSSNSGITLTSNYVYSGCNTNVNIVKPISVGKVQPGPINVLLVDPYIGRIQVEVEPVLGATDYRWYKDGVLQTIYHSTFAQIPIKRNVCDVGYGITVTSTNVCGVSAATYKGVYVPPCNNYYMVSPNPAASDVSVSTDESKTQSASSETFDEVRIYDFQGTLKKYQKFNKVKTAMINISGLNNGNYFIEISDGTYKERHQLLIQK